MTDKKYNAASQVAWYMCRFSFASGPFFILYMCFWHAKSLVFLFIVLLMSVVNVQAAS